MRRLFAIVLGSSVLSLALAGTAFAAVGMGAVGKPESRPAPVTKFDFEDDDIIGNIAGSTFMIIDAKSESRHSSLIKVREHFMPELMRTVHDI